MASLLLNYFVPLLLLTPLTTIVSAADFLGPSTAKTTRYWDCCKPSCAWSDKGSFISSNPVQTCGNSNNPLTDVDAGTGCNGGPAYSCADQSPWAVNDTFSYGFAGAYLKGGEEGTWCCGCYELKFTSGSIKGKTILVQASNTDYEMPDENVFTFGIPGGNTSYANACATQYNVSSTTFGTENIGVASRSDCDALPTPLKDGCYWRFDWFEDAQAPTVEYKRVPCPKVLTDITKCVRTDDATFSAATNETTKSSAASLPGCSPSVFSLGIVAMLVSWTLFV